MRIGEDIDVLSLESFTSHVRLPEIGRESVVTKGEGNHLCLHTRQHNPPGRVLQRGIEFHSVLSIEIVVSENPLAT